MLFELVDRFTRPHAGEHFDVDTRQTTTVRCESYWQQLVDLVAEGNGSMGTGGGQASRILGNQDARELQTRITRVVNTQWPGAGRRHLLRKPVPEKVRLWAAHIRGNQDHEQHLADWLAHWIHQIDNLAQPEIGSTLPACPDCGNEYYWTQRSHGRKRIRALETNGHAVWCNPCGSRWEGIAGMTVLADTLA